MYKKIKQMETKELLQRLIYGSAEFILNTKVFI